MIFSEFQKKLSKLPLGILGPLWFWKTYLHQKFPQIHFVDAKQNNSVNELVQPSLFASLQPEIYVIENCFAWKKDQIEEALSLKTVVLLDHEDSKVKDFEKTFIHFPFAHHKKFYIEAIFDFLNRPIDNALTSILVNSAETLEDLWSTLLFLDLYFGENPFTVEESNKFLEKSSPQNSIEYCKAVLQALPQIQKKYFALDTNKIALNSLLNKMAYTNVIARNYPHTLPAWMVKNHSTSEHDLEVIKNTVEFEENIKLSRQDEETGFLHLILKSIT